MSSASPITTFLAHRRLAFVGVSRDPKDFSRSLFRDWQARGYELVPIHPEAAEIEGRKAYPRIADVDPPVRAAFVMTPPAQTERVARECADAGVEALWMHRGVGQGAVSDAAVAACRSRGMSVVAGACPFMFLPGSGGVHAFHRFVLKLFGRLPS
jgi:uncharacterized protein